MTTTAFDDQFTVGTQPIEPVRKPYDIEAILRRNVADLEIALRKQTERAEAAEAELEAVREDNHGMMLEIDGLRTERDRLTNELTKLREQKPILTVFRFSGGDGGTYGSVIAPPNWNDSRDDYARDVAGHGEWVKAYAHPVPAPAVPAEWREVMAELAADLQAACDAEHPHRDQYPSIMRKYQNDMRIVERARAMLQSAPKAIDGVEN